MMLDQNGLRNLQVKSENKIVLTQGVCVCVYLLCYDELIDNV